MEERILGRTGRAVSVIGLGTWQLGADWGEVDDADALAVLDAAAKAGVTLLDTADVYGDGRSERLIGRFLAGNPGLRLTVATKMGRRVALDPALYTLGNFRSWTDRSRANLGVDTLDLVQLHCPPAPVYALDAVYDALDTLVDEQRIAAYGVSVETCDEALTAIERPGTASVQIILNAFRRKPLEQVLPAARAAGVGIIARVPLALLRSRLRHRRGRRTGVRRAGPRRGHSRAGRPPLGHPARRRGRGDPRCPQQRPGQAECRRRRPAAVHRRGTRRHQGHLRPAHPGPGPRPLVGAAPRPARSPPAAASPG